MKNLFLLLFITATIYGQTGSKIKLYDPWIRNASSGMNTGMFVKIENLDTKDDDLIGVECDFAEVSEIHEVFKNGDMMGMRSVKKITVKAKSTIELKPRDYHIMFIKLTKELKTGDKKTVKLKFKNAGLVSVTAVVKEMGNYNKRNKK